MFCIKEKFEGFFISEFSSGEVKVITNDSYSFSQSARPGAVFIFSLRLSTDFLSSSLSLSSSLMSIS